LKKILNLLSGLDSQICSIDTLIQRVDGMKVDINLDLTQILAFWGTVVSTIAVTWNTLRGLQDKRKLKVEGNIGIGVYT
jgi:hypothetical protein